MDVPFQFFKRLPTDLTVCIAERLLDDDVVDYMACRAVCSEWRNNLKPPSGFAFCFRPRRWIMLSDGDANIYTPDSRRFLNLTTGKSLLLRLPELDTDTVISDSDGLLVLVDNSTYAVRLFNPFTHHLADLPSVPKDMEAAIIVPSLMTFFGAFISCDDCPVVTLVSPNSEIAMFAKPGDSSWGIIHFAVHLTSMLFFKGEFYIAHPLKGIQSIKLDQKLCKPLIPPVPAHYGFLDLYYLVEYNEEMLLVYRKTTDDGLLLTVQNQAFKVFKVDLESCTLVPLINRTELAIFLGLGGRSLVLSVNRWPSLESNSIYVCTREYRNSIIRHNIDDKKHEVISEDSSLHDGFKKICPSVRPFTLVHHLATYCAPLHWSNGLMYHEFMTLPHGWLSFNCRIGAIKGKYRLFVEQFHDSVTTAEDKKIRSLLDQ